MSRTRETQLYSEFYIKNLLLKPSTMILAKIKNNTVKECS